MYEVPLLVQVVFPDSAATLASCSRYLRCLVHNCTQHVSVRSLEDIRQLMRSKWPQLCTVLVQPTFAEASFNWPEDGNLELVAALGVRNSKSTSSSSTAFVVRPARWQLQLHNQDDHAVRASASLGSSNWQALSQFSLNNCTLEQYTVAMQDAFKCLGLRYVDINISRLDAAVSSLAKGALPLLKKLSLKVTNVTAGSIQSLAAAQMPLLDSLTLIASDSADNVMFMPTTATWPQLTFLSLSGLHLMPRCFQCLAVVHHAHLQCLLLKSMQLSAANMSDLMQLPWLRLHTLEISHNHMGPDELAALLPKAMPALRFLCLVDTNLCAAAIEYLTRCSWPHLQGLSLACNCIDGTALASP